MQRHLVANALARPLRMLFMEPIVSVTCAYVACEFATLFSFFACVPLVFEDTYGLSMEQSGLVFLSIVVGCLLGAVTVLICDVLLYRRKAAAHISVGTAIPPEIRLYPSLIGSIGLPVGLFWFGWTSHAGAFWAYPAAAIVLFAWSNFCIFLSTSQFIVDAYHGSTVASAMSANSMARYCLSAIFPLFTVQCE